MATCLNPGSMWCGPWARWMAAGRELGSRFQLSFEQGSLNQTARKFGELAKWTAFQLGKLRQTHPSFVGGRSCLGIRVLKTRGIY
jgi:hypothetical protein